MKTFVVRDGPASLCFLAFLLKKKHPEHRIHVVEQDPGATYRWGVEFSGVAVGAIQAADEELFGDVIRGHQSCKYIRVVRGRQGVYTYGNQCSHTPRLEVLAKLESACERSKVRLAHGDVTGAKVQGISSMAVRVSERET
ncbi:hypothetical protein [Cupriavidus basilensis]|uniref:hypothetical protein n=1 Tax=Cupriavidus basilensis TaxID=68895 RepID=UPI0005B7D360|nr:hypothetical protein [Cupriavidus basilensis]